MRLPFKKVLSKIEREEAHGGSGSRQVILSRDDAVSSQLQSMTKGFLTPGAIFDWHEHEGVDELFLVTQGTGVIRFRTGTEITYQPEQIVYIPANQEHQIENTGSKENQFFFIRLNV